MIGVCAARNAENEQACEECLIRYMKQKCFMRHYRPA